MSGQVLSPDAIAALVDAATEGRLPEEPPATAAAAGACARSTSRARRSSPPTRSAASSARWTRSAAPPRRACRPSCACRSSSRSSTSASSRGPTRTRRCPRARSRAIVDVAPIGTRMLLSAEMNLVLGAIELLLGGVDDGGVSASAG